MTFSILKIHQITEVPRLAPGHYDGIWSGYRITLEDGWLLTMGHGVRGRCACRVDVAEDGSVGIATYDRAVEVFPLSLTYATDQTTISESDDP